MRYLAICAMLVLGSGFPVEGVFAQSRMYKCGNTFSQTPCALDAKEVELKSSDPCAIESNRYTSACIGRPMDMDKLDADMKRLANQKYPDNPPLSEVLEANKALCQRGILDSLKDPESARITNLRRQAPRNHYYDGKFNPGVSYAAEVNAKNSYGGYLPIWTVCSAPQKGGG